MFPETYPYDHHYRFQNFEYFVVMDFEATCDKDKPPFPQEIIEFPSVVVGSATGQLEACFQTYVRPTCNRILTDFCKDLTGIQQVQVYIYIYIFDLWVRLINYVCRQGVTLSEAILSHDQWLEKSGIKNTNFAVVTWSDWDCRVMLESECRYKNIPKPPYFNRWINLKVPFHEIFGMERCNLKQAVEKAGLAWEGRLHCGLDDAKNTARLLALIMQRGFKLSITNPLNAVTWAPQKPLFVPLQHPQRHYGLPSSRVPCCYCGVAA
ncbi:hypothetical protein DH2020_044701 [Rehmannia glutinosa]|uniref:Exonuclease domain-containing protein n=1 Tax=Rehmannia glutinosa TaxID=99300 RepID=A0ABR0UHS2_REHGL